MPPPINKPIKKRKLSQAYSTTNANDLVIDAVVAVILLILESSRPDVELIIQSLKKDNLAELNTTIAAIISRKQNRT